MAVRIMAARKGGNFVAIAATRHGAPPPPARPRHVGKEEAATRIGANAHARGGSLDKNLRRRTGDGRQQPIQTILPGHELQTPFGILKNEFVMSFRNA